MISFVEWLIADPSSEDGVWTLQWLVQEQWSMDLVYEAASCHDSALLPFLLKDWTDKQRMLKAATASCINSVWNVLQQLQDFCSWTSGGHAWWLCSDDLRSNLFHFALDALMIQPEDWNPSLRKDDATVSLCGFKTSQVELILHVSATDTPITADCLRRLSDEASRLQDGRFTDTIYTRFSLTCFHLLAKTTKDEQAFAPLLEEALPKILACAFPFATPTNHTTASAVSETSLRLVSSLFESHSTAVHSAIDRLADVRSFTESACAALSSKHETNAGVADIIIRRLQLLHRIDRSMVREYLSASFHEGRESNTLVDVLTYHAKQNDLFSAASWLRELVADRTSIVRHDGFSQSLRCGSFFEYVVELSRDDTNPMLSIVADICCIVPPIYCATDGAEALIQLVVPPTEKRMKVPPKDGEFDCDTPTAANLSRLDSSIVNWPEAEVSEETSRGLDPSIKLSVALLLATVAPMCDPVVQSRAVEAATNALRQYGGYAMSMDTTVRSLKLTNSLADPDSEIHLAEIAHSEGRQLMREKEHQRKIIRRQETTIQELRAQLDEAQAEKDALRLQLQQASSKFRLEKSQLLQSSSREATRAIRGHIKEKQDAEKLANEIASEFEDAQSKVLILSGEAKAANAELEQTKSSLRRSTEEMENLRRHQKEIEAKLKQKVEIMGEAKERLQESTEKEAELLDRIQRQHDDIIDLHENETELRDGLENLFEDMVFLARMYEHLEKQASTVGNSRRDEVTNLKARVQELQNENRDLSERETRALHEKELVDKKYAKLKEKVAQETREYRREDERRVQRSSSATVSASYMSHLHANSSRRRDRHKTSDSENEKENASIASSRRSQNK